MITFSLTKDWDLFLDNQGNIATKSDKEQIAQDVASSCRVWRGEDIWHVNRGIPYKSEIMGHPINISLLQAYANEQAKRVNDVQNAKVIITSFNNRTLTQDIIITTTDGETINV